MHNHAARFITKSRLCLAWITLPMAGCNNQVLPRASVAALCWYYWFLVLRKRPCFEQHPMEALLKTELCLLQAFKPSKTRSQLQDSLPSRRHSICYHFPLPIPFEGIFATLSPILIQEYLSFNQHLWFLGQLTENSCFAANPVVAVPASCLECNTNSSVIRTQPVLQKYSLWLKV